MAMTATRETRRMGVVWHGTEVAELTVRDPARPRHERVVKYRVELYGHMAFWQKLQSRDRYIVALCGGVPSGCNCEAAKYGKKECRHVAGTRELLKRRK